METIRLFGWFRGRNAQHTNDCFPAHPLIKQCMSVLTPTQMGVCGRKGVGYLFLSDEVKPFASKRDISNKSSRVLNNRDQESKNPKRMVCLIWHISKCVCRARVPRVCGNMSKKCFLRITFVEQQIRILEYFACWVLIFCDLLGSQTPLLSHLYEKLVCAWGGGQSYAPRI